MAICQSLLLFHLYSSDFACSIIILKELLWQLVFVQSSFDGFALDVFVWFFFCCVLSTCIIIKEQLLMQQLHPNQRSIFILCQNHHHHLQASFCEPKKTRILKLAETSLALLVWKIWFLLYVVQNQGLNKKINCESKESENKIAKQQEAALICELCFATGSCNRFWERFLQLDGSVHRFWECFSQLGQSVHEILLQRTEQNVLFTLFWFRDLEI